MTKHNYTPDIVDFAYQIIALYEENTILKDELVHYKKMHELNCKELEQSDIHTKKITGILLTAAIDPDSVINRGQRAMIEDQMHKTKGGEAS